MAESTGLAPVSLVGRLLSGQLPRLAGRSPEMVGEEGFEPSESPRSERGAFANLTTRPGVGPAPRIRTGNLQALDLTPLPVGLEPDGPPRWIRTSTDQGLSLMPLPIGPAADGAGRRIRTFTERGLSPLLLPIERVPHVMAEGERVELPSPRALLFERSGLADCDRTLRVYYDKRSKREYVSRLRYEESMEATTGIEPATVCLQGSCSTD